IIAEVVVVAGGEELAIAGNRAVGDGYRPPGVPIDAPDDQGRGDEPRQIGGQLASNSHLQNRKYRNVVGLMSISATATPNAAPMRIAQRIFGFQTHCRAASSPPVAMISCVFGAKNATSSRPAIQYQACPGD